MSTRAAWHLILAVLLGVSPTQGSSPWHRHTIDNTSQGADGVRLADVNGDGQPDIATGWEEGNIVRVYLHPGPAQVRKLWPAVTVGPARSVEDAVFVDLDSDGAWDVVSSCEGENRTVQVHWGPRDPARYLDPTAWLTRPFPVTRGQQQWMYALPMQIDGRYGTDLVVGSKNVRGSIGWLEAPRNARDLNAWRLHRLREAGWIMSLEQRDMDGDGDADLLVSDRQGQSAGVFWLQNPGAQLNQLHSAWQHWPIGAEGGQAMFLTQGDLDRDGQHDVVVAIRNAGLLFLRRTGPAARDFGRYPIVLPAGCGVSKAVALGDIDLDGRPDLVFSCELASAGKSGVRWLAYSNSPSEQSWKDHEISGRSGVKFDRVELVDLDSDGDLDVLTCEERDNLGVIWYENPTR